MHCCATSSLLHRELLRTSDAARQQLLAASATSAAAPGVLTDASSDLAAVERDFVAEAQAIADDIERLAAVDVDVARLAQQVCPCVIEHTHTHTSPLATPPFEHTLLTVLANTLHATCYQSALKWERQLCCN